MKTTITYSALRANLKAFCDQVCDEHEPLVIERQNGDNLVLLSADDYASMQETFYLLRSPANAERLISSAETPRSKMREFDTIEDLKHALGV